MDLFSLTAITSKKDQRQTSPLSKERLYSRRVAATWSVDDEENDDTSMTKIERLRLRTQALHEAHRANSEKALADERLIREKDERAQLMQLSLRGLLDIVERQGEVADMDLARTMYEDNQLSSTISSRHDRVERPPSPVQNALNKRSTQLWKERLINDLELSTSVLIYAGKDEYDTRLEASRKILEIVQELSLEAAESRHMCKGTRNAVNSELEFFLFGGRNSRSNEDFGNGSGTAVDLGSSSSSMRSKTRGRLLDSLHSTRRISPSRLSPVRTSPTLNGANTRKLQAESERIAGAYSSPSAAAANPNGPTASSVSLLHTFASLPAFEEVSLTSPVLREHQAQLSQKLLRYSDLKARWSQIIAAELKPFKLKALENISEFQTAWLKILTLTSKTHAWGNRLEKRRFEIAEERAKIEAVIKMQSIFRGGFERSIFDKFTRVREMLLRRLWIIRLNIHTKQRKKQAALVRSFINDFVVNANPFKTVVAKFRWKIIWTQRHVRSFLRCKRARILVLTRKWLKIEVKVARARKEREEAAIKKAFSSMLEGGNDNNASDETSDGGTFLSENERVAKEAERRKAERRKLRRSSSAGFSLITGRPRSPQGGNGKGQSGAGTLFSIAGANKRTEMAAKQGLRKMSRRASFGTTSQIALAELRKNMDLVEDEERRATQNRLIKAMEDCSTLSRKLDYVKNSKKKRVKLTRAILNKLSGKNEGPKKVGKAIRGRLLLNLYRSHRLAWSRRPPRPLTTNAETVAAAKLLLSVDQVPNPEQMEEVKARARLPEFWIFYSVISDEEMAELVKKGFLEQDKETKASASAFWESLG